MNIILTRLVKNTHRYAEALHGSSQMGHVLGPMDAGKTTALAYAKSKLESARQGQILRIRGCTDVPRIYLLHELHNCLSKRNCDRHSMSPPDMLKKIVDAAQKSDCRLLIIDFHGLILETTVFELLEFMDCIRQAGIPMGLLVASMQIKQGIMPFAESYAGNTLLRPPLFATRYNNCREITGLLRAADPLLDSFCGRIDREEPKALDVAKKIFEATEGIEGRILRVASSVPEGSRAQLSDQDVNDLLKRSMSPI